jgi:TolB protein
VFRKITISVCLLVMLVLSSACQPEPAAPTPTTSAGIPNPASLHCEQQGYEQQIVTADDGSQSGICLFPDGSQCDEWAFYRGECGPSAHTGATPPPSAPTGQSSTPPAEDSGQLVFDSNRAGVYSDLYRMNLDGSEVTRLAGSDSNLFAGPWSPDGQQILFTGFGPFHSYIGVIQADGSGLAALSQPPNSDEGFPAWSPDGKQIAFTSGRDGNNELYLMNADGSGQVRLTNSPGDDFAPAWSPDGSQIAFVSDRDRTAGVYSLYVMAVEGSTVRRLTHDEGSTYTPAWSPDGSQIALRLDHNGLSDIYLVNADGSGLQNLTGEQGANWSPAWSADGEQITFQSNRDGNWEIYLMDRDGRNPRNVTQHAAKDAHPYLRP